MTYHSFPSFEFLGNPGNFYADDGLHLSDVGYGIWQGWLTTAMFGEQVDDCFVWRENEEGFVCVDGGTVTSSAPTPSPSPAPGNDSGSGIFSDSGGARYSIAEGWAWIVAATITLFTTFKSFE